MMKMQIGMLAFLVALFAIESGFASPNTVPAFLWSPHLQRGGNGGMDEAVNYQVMSSKDLVDSVFTQGGWSNILCSEKKVEQPVVDVALVFIGRELVSSDVSSKRNSNPSLVNTLNGLFTSSNFSLAFPYIAAPEEERMESLLLSGLKQACPHNVGVSNIVFSDSCFVEDGTIQKLSDLQSFKDHLLARKETRKEGETDLVVLCSEGSESKGQSHSERESISELVSSVEQSGSKYTALYVSDPYWYTSYKTLQRFLAESGTGNSTVGVATGCDELCKFKSSLLEGILVGIVFLLILISGLCCMAGIDTPTRFETPQDS
ncbi:2-C-methyl-D-erythritol 4-phosphate cytidylyltransferase [Hirschfeldia incana]|nr:2-C-methyl-D-erythritol 4-phosphate cytidylyltransferase [Hirschfeldia incana]